MTSYDEVDLAPSQFNSLVALWDAHLPESKEMIPHTSIFVMIVIFYSLMHSPGHSSWCARAHI